MFNFPPWGYRCVAHDSYRRSAESWCWTQRESAPHLPAAPRTAPHLSSAHLYWQHHLRRGRVLRLQRDLQVEDVVDDVLQDLHLAHRLVLRDAGHQLLQLGVAVVHVAQGARRLVRARVFIPADGETLLRDAAHGLVAAPHRADGTDGFHNQQQLDRWDELLMSSLPLSWVTPLYCDSDLHVGFYTPGGRRRPLPRTALRLAGVGMQARSHWLVSPCGRAGKNEEMRRGCLEGIVNQLPFPGAIWK